MQSLREERARLRSALEKRDARVLQLEENLAQVSRPHAAVLCRRSPLNPFLYLLLMSSCRATTLSSLVPGLLL